MIKFMALDPQHAGVDLRADQHLVLGKALRKLAQELNGDTRSRLLLMAAAELKSAISVGGPTAEMFQHLGAVEELLGDARQAIATYSKGLHASPDNISLRNLRGWAYVNGHQWEPAQADFSEALRIAPNDAEARAGMGFVLAELGRYDEAREEASVALLTAPDSQLVQHNVACIYAQLSEANPPQKVEHENLALAALQRAVFISRQHALGPDGDELELIKVEAAFPPSLRSRTEFRQLLEQSTADIR
jgi:tetratricopeptide (TPR) repeat protein